MAHFPRTSLSDAAPRSPEPQARDAAVAAAFRRYRTVPPRAGRSAGRRVLARAAACALMLALLPGCRRDAPSAAPAAPAAAAPAARYDNKNKENTPVDAHAPSEQSEQPPAPDAVLYFIYNKDGDGATSYEIENGSTATYWYGHEFDLGGKRYFTGFAYDTPEKYGNDQDEGYPDPDAKVTLTSATFLLSRPGTEKPWSFVGAERWIGEFGGYEKADGIDASRKPISHETTDGQLVLAIPTRSFQSGHELAGYAMFRFQPGELDDVEDRHWRYLGTVDAGGDNSAACDGGEVMPCVSSTGTLAFEKGTGVMPDIVMSYEGTTIEAPGKTRELGEQDRTVYRYVPERKEYAAQ